jgi:glycosyltransferase involved in cell wall biosynthesis
MEQWPRISIVTPSFNQGHYIVATIESVLAQQYPNFEHIIIDGGSTDMTLDVLRRYPHLHVISEPDRGHADALNKGFRLATGDIWSFLNSDDTLLPHALHRVAQEIDPQRGRHIVMGRCRFIDAQGRFTGIEHPSLQAITACSPSGKAIPFHSQRSSGRLRYGIRAEAWMRVWVSWIDYDLFCRFTR